jgi:hypothetical protein
MTHCEAEREADEDLEIQRPIELGKLHDSSFVDSDLRNTDPGFERFANAAKARRVGRIVEGMRYTVNCKETRN